MSKFSFNITPFKGDPTTFMFFQEQVEAFIKINKLDAEEALLFVKSRLEGPAFTYYIESPILQGIKSHTEFLNNLKVFFSHTTENKYASELENLCLLPGENLRSLAHRINRLTKLVYPDIEDEVALQKIQQEKFVRLLPAAIKVKLLDLKPESFSDAVEKADGLLQHYAQHNILNLLTSTPHLETTEQIKTLTAEINFLKQSANNPTVNSTKDNSQHNQAECRQNNSFPHKEQRSRMFHPKTPQYHVNKQRPNRNFSQSQRLKCQFCEKFGHDLKTCRVFYYRFGPKEQDQQPQLPNHPTRATSYLPQGQFQYPNTAYPPPLQAPPAFSHPPPPPPSSLQSGHPVHPKLVVRSCVGASAPQQFLAPQQPQSCIFSQGNLPINPSATTPFLNIHRNKSTQTFDDTNSHVIDHFQNQNKKNQVISKYNSVHKKPQVQQVSSSTQTNAPTEDFIFSVYESNTLIIPPVILITLAKLDFKFLVDSGSSISLISAELFKSIKSFIHYKFLSRNVVIKTINSAVKFLGCAEISFTINKNFFRHPFFLVELSDQAEFQGLLGIDFLQKNAMTVNFQDATLNFKDQEIPFFQSDVIPQSSSREQNLNVVVENNVNNQNIVSPNFEREKEIVNNHSVEPNSNNISAKDKHENSSNVSVVNKKNVNYSGIFEARFQNKIIIHPGEERYAVVFFDTPYNSNNFTFESILDKKTIECPYSLFSSCVSDAENSIKSKNHSFNILIKNLTDECKHFHKGQLAGHVYEVDEIQELELPTQNFEKVNLITASNETLNLRKTEFSLENFNLNHLPPNEAVQIKSLLSSNWSVFSSSLNTMGHTDHVIPQINFTSDFPRRSLPYPIPQKLQAEAKKQLDEMKEAGIISSTISDWACPLLMVKKKIGADGVQKYRFALDLRLVNAIITQSAYPLPKIQDIIANISKFKYYTNLDLHSAYNQIDLPEEYRQKLAFNTPFGTFQYNRLVFGLKNSASIFQALMNKILDEVNLPGLFAYQDDLVVASNSLPETIEKLTALFKCLAKYNLTLSPTKCNYHQNTIDYLGFRISQNQIEPIKSNITKITAFPTPKNKKQLKRFLGLCSFYRCVVSKFSEKTVILNNLTTPKAEFKWNQQHEDAFRELQKYFFMQPFLRQPDWDRMFFLNTDASDQAISACLLQEFDGHLLPVSYFSKTLSKSEARYPAIKKELMAIVKGVQAFKFYLYHRVFTVLSDSLPLKHFKKVSLPADLTTRWILQLDEYTFNFNHVAGCDNVLADYFSRLPESPPKQSLSTHPDILFSDEVLPIEEVSQHSKDNTKTSQVNTIHVSQNRKQPKDPLLEVSIETLLIEQQKDPNIIKIYKSIIEKKPTTSNKHFYIDGFNSLLVFDTARSDNIEKRFTPKIVVPPTLIPKVLRIAHLTHFGLQKTYQLLQRNYWWKGMFNDTKEFVNSCNVCLCVKPQKLPQAPFQSTFLPSHPSEMISLDLVGPFSNNHHILTVIDIFSRHMELYPIKSITAGKIAEKIFKYVCAYGRPAQVLTDLGRQFDSAVFQNLNEVFQINLMYTTSGHPQANGISERINSSIKATIQALQCEGKSFFHAVDLHKSIYNGSLHPSTGFSPNQVHFSRELSLITDLVDPAKMSPVLNLSQSLHEIFIAINQIYSLVYENLQRAQQMSQSMQQNFKKLRHFSPGDIVYIKPVKRFSKKLDGPFVIVERISPVNYTIRRAGNPLARVSKFHVDRLVLSRQRPRHLVEQSPVQSAQHPSAAAQSASVSSDNVHFSNNNMSNTNSFFQFSTQGASSLFTDQPGSSCSTQKSSDQHLIFVIPPEPHLLPEEPSVAGDDASPSTSPGTHETPALSPVAQSANQQTDEASMPNLSPVLPQSPDSRSVPPIHPAEVSTTTPVAAASPRVDQVTPTVFSSSFSPSPIRRIPKSHAKHSALVPHQYSLRSQAQRRTRSSRFTVSP